MLSVFVTYVSNDKEVAQQISDRLQERGVETNDVPLGLGAVLSYKVEEGFKGAQYGIIILSQSFFKRRWPEADLKRVATIDQEFGGDTSLLPVLHDIEPSYVSRFSPDLARRAGVPTAAGIDVVVGEILQVVAPDAATPYTSTMPEQKGAPVLGEEMYDRSRLRDVLTTYFSNSELQSLAFDLDIDYDDLPGNTKSAKARELIVYLDRRGRLDELVRLVRIQRPNAAW
jgi:hypothetical protein